MYIQIRFNCKDGEEFFEMPLSGCTKLTLKRQENLVEFWDENKCIATVKNGEITSKRYPNTDFESMDIYTVSE